LLAVACLGLVGFGVWTWRGSRASTATVSAPEPSVEYPDLPQEAVGATPAEGEPQEEAHEPPAPGVDESPTPSPLGALKTRPTAATGAGSGRGATAAEEKQPQPAEAPSGAPTPETTAHGDAAIEARLRELAKEADALEDRFRAFAASCLTGSPTAAAGRTGDAGRNWFEIWSKETERAVRQNTSGIPTGSGVPPVDCQKGWQELAAGANRIAGELQQLEDAARAANVLPGRWRQLQATYRVEGWDVGAP
jgi:hypothetical protein